MTDLRHVLRTLRRSPTFTVTVVITLALGMGANTALFSALHALLLKPLPHPEADRLVALYEWHPERGRSPVSLTSLLDWSEQASGFSAMAGYRFRTFAAQRGTGDDPVVIRTVMATSEVFSVLGMEPTLGRSWSAREEEAEEPLVVLTEPYWRTCCGGSRDVVGQRILLNEVPHTVLGVLGAGAEFPAPGSAPDAFIPLSHSTYGRSRTVRSLDVIARLDRGVSRESARSELRTIAARLNDTDSARSADLEDLHEALHGDNRRPLLLLLGAGSLLLVIACTNVAHLLVMRFLDRRRKVAVRVALGARPGQLARLFLVEGAVLSLLGAVAGWFVAQACLDALPKVLELLGGIPEVAGARPGLEEAGVFLFAAALSVATTLLFALVPTVLARRTDVQQVLKDGSIAGRGVVRSAMVVGQIALSMVLVLCAGLLLRSFYAVLATDTGFDSSGVRHFGLGLPESRYGERDIVDFHGRLLEKLRAVDGVEAAGAAARAPAGSRRFTTRFEVEGDPPSPEPRHAAINVVSSGFFMTLRIPLLEGRPFSTRDRPEVTRVLLVNQAFKKAHLGPQALGRRLRLSWASELHPTGSLWEVVGVVGDTRSKSLEEAPEPAVYLPLTQFPVEGAIYFMRTERGDPDFHAAVKAAVASIDPALVEPVVGSFEELVRRGLSNRRLALLLAGTFALLGLALTVTGVYALMASGVARRRREMAIRRVLGARRQQVERLVLGQGLLLALCGILVGAGAFMFLARLIESLLYETSPRDPLTVLAVALVVGATSLGACLVPSRRASRISPVSVLRSE